MVGPLQFISSPIILFTLLPQAWPWLGAGLTLGITIAILLKLGATLTQHPEHHALANEEIAAALFSAFIIAFWLTMDSFIQNVINALINIPPNTAAPFQGLSVAHLDLALIQLSVFQNQLLSLYIRLSLIDFFIGFVSTISFNLGTLPGGIGFFSLYIAPYGSFSLISQALGKIVDGVMLLALTIWAKQILVILAKTAIPLILLPLGIIMRAIPFTRKVGSTIIAVCFALYFVYPLAVSLSFYIIFDVYHLEFDRTYIDYASPFKSQMTPSDIDGIIRDIKTNDKSLQNSIGGENKGDVVADTIEKACGIQPNDSALTRAAKYLLCGVDKIVSITISATSSVPTLSEGVRTGWEAMKAMITYSGGFFSWLFSSGSILLPTGVILGLYILLTDIVTKIAELFVVVSVATILEIMITVTMYRNIALLIGGEAELPGLSKLV